MAYVESKKRLEKIVISGDVVEYIRYINPINVDVRNHSIIKDEETSEGKKDNNLFRARQAIRRIIWCNQTKYSKFVTLTYKDTELDYDNIVYDFKQFIKKLRRRGFNCPYLWVSEHQKERGLKEGNEGCFHLHAVLFSDTFIKNSIIEECWGKGFTKINSIKKVNNLGAYVCKYLTKEEFDLYHKHSYHISRGLKKPVEICHDGYIGDYSKFTIPDFFENIEFTFSGTSEFSYVGPDGVEVTNSFIYQQGVLKE